jgi:hypothetical protein
MVFSLRQHSMVNVLLFAVLSLTLSKSLFAAPADGLVTLNPADKGANVVLSSGNMAMTIVNGVTDPEAVRSTRGISQGEGIFYLEISDEDSASGNRMFGVATSAVSLTADHATLDSDPEAGLLRFNFLIDVFGLLIDYRGAKPIVHFFDSNGLIDTASEKLDTNDPVFLFISAASGSEDSTVPEPQHVVNYGGNNGADFTVFADTDALFAAIDSVIFNGSKSVQFGLPVDQAHPTVSINEGSQWVANNGSVSFNVTATEDGGGDLAPSVQWYLDGVLIGTGTSINPATVAAGTYLLKAEVEDSIGLKSSDTVYLYVHPTSGGGDLDHDFDGLTYDQEILAGTDPANPDSDSDGLSDGYEVAGGLGGIALHLNEVKLSFESDSTASNVTTTDSGLGTGYTQESTQGFIKSGIRANQPMNGEFRYWEGYAISDYDMGFGVMGPNIDLDSFCCVSGSVPGDWALPAADSAAPSLAVNSLLGNSIWRNLVFQNFYSNNDPYLGFAVDYTGADPIVYVIGSTGVQLVDGNAATTLTDFSGEDIFPVVYGNAASAPRASMVQTVNFGKEPFFYDVVQALTDASVANVSDLVPGWGAHRQFQHLGISISGATILSTSVESGDPVILNGTATDAAGADSSSSIAWTVTDSSENDVTLTFVGQATPTGSSVTVTPNTTGTFTVTASITDSKTGQAFTQTATITTDDTTPPNINDAPAGPIDVIVGPTNVISLEQISSAVLVGVTADDNADPSPTLGVRLVDDSALATSYNFADGPINVEITATDSVPLTAESAAIQVNFVDQTAPTINDAPTGPIEIAVGSGNSVTSAQISAALLSGVSATDNVDPSPTLAVRLANDSPLAATYTFQDGSISAEITATDSNGQVAESSAITVEFTANDTSAPALTVPADITVNSANGDALPATQSEIAAFLSGATAFDTVEGNITVTNNAPSSFPVGATTVTFTATDSANNTIQGSAVVVVIETELSPSVDSDGDGTSDADEGTGDADGDRIPDYLDSSTIQTELPVSSGNGSSNPQVLSSAEPGIQFVLGDTAFASGSGDATVTIQDVMDYGDGGSPVANGDDAGQYFPSGIIDFEIRNVTAGNSVDVIIPQSTPIPANAVYRKYTAAGGWVDFVVNANNAVASAPSVSGACPAANDTAYVTGLTAGHDCVRLRIEDGGPNDADGIANGTIKDPGGVSIQVVVTATRTAAASATTFANGSGEQTVMSFTISNNAGDAVLNELVLSASGTLNDTSDISGVSLYLDANSDGTADSSTALATGTYSADDGTVTLTFTTPYSLPVGTTQFLVTYTF